MTRKQESQSDIRTKQINVGRIIFIDIIDHPSVSAWMEHLIDNSYKEFVRVFCENNEERFDKLFGESLPNIPSSFDPNWGKCWKVHQNHLTWLVFTGKMGTIFLVETSLTQKEFKFESNIGLSIVKFLEILKEKLSCNE